MTNAAPSKLRSDISVAHLTRPDEAALDNLVCAAQETIEDGSDSAWGGKPSAQTLRAYWNGVILSPQRHLIVGRLGGAIVGAVQVVQAGPLSEVGPEVASLDKFFIAPSARGHGLARRIMRYAEDVARAHGIISLDMVIREDRKTAMRMIEQLGYRQWARKDTFSLVDGAFQAGLFFTKLIDEQSLAAMERTQVA